MEENRFSLIISAAGTDYRINIEKKPMEFYDPIHGRQIDESWIPDDFKGFLTRNLGVLQFCCSELQHYTDTVTSDYPASGAMGKGFNSKLTISKDEGGAFHADVSFYDRQGNNAHHATGVLIGGLRALAETSGSKECPSIDWKTGEQGSIHFNSLHVLDIALKQRAKARSNGPDRTSFARG